MWFFKLIGLSAIWISVSLMGEAVARVVRG